MGSFEPPRKTITSPTLRSSGSVPLRIIKSPLPNPPLNLKSRKFSFNIPWFSYHEPQLSQYESKSLFPSSYVLPQSRGSPSPPQLVTPCSILQETTATIGLLVERTKPSPGYTRNFITTKAISTLTTQLRMLLSSQMKCFILRQYPETEFFFI